MLHSMYGGVTSLGAVDVLLWNAGLSMSVGVAWCAVLAAVAFLAPNSNLIGERVMVWFARSVDARWMLGSAAAAGVVLLVVLNTARDSVSAFIYFNF